MKALLKISLATTVEVELTREEFDEIEESAPLCEDDLPESVQAQIDPSRLVKRVDEVKIVEIVEDSEEARKERRKSRQRSQARSKARNRGAP